MNAALKEFFRYFWVAIFWMYTALLLLHIGSWTWSLGVPIAVGGMLMSFLYLKYGHGTYPWPRSKPNNSTEDKSHGS